MLIKLDRVQKSKKIKQHAMPDMEEGDLLMQFDARKPANITEAYAAVSRRLQELQTAMAQVHEARYNEGFSAGENAGIQQGLDTIRGPIQSLNQVILEIQQQQTELLKNSEQFVVNFALKLLEKIMGTDEFRKLRIDSTKLNQLIERALSEFAESSKFVIRLHRELATVLDGRKAELNEMLVHGGTVVVIEDPSLQPGDCLIETDFGVLDARIDSQINELKSVFNMQNDR